MHCPPGWGSNAKLQADWSEITKFLEMSNSTKKLQSCLLHDYNKLNKEIVNIWFVIQNTFLQLLQIPHATIQCFSLMNTLRKILPCGVKIRLTFISNQI